MKISGVGPSGTSSTRRTEKARRADGSFADHLHLDDGADEGARRVDAPSSLTGIESLLAIQSVNPDGGRRAADERALRRGEDLLERLEDIRRGLLLGAIPKERLGELARMTRSTREAGVDPHLSAILDEIELRAEVELAKLSRR